MIKWIVRTALKLFYKVEIHGLEHYRQAEGRVLVVANHTSFLDGVLLGAFLPGRFTFAVNTYIARAWWMKPMFLLARLLPMDPANPMSLKRLIRHLEQGHKAVIFPEGRITVTGSLMKIYHGPGMVADKAGATVVPVRIEGAQYSRFSRLGEGVRRRWFPKITLTVLPPRCIELPENIKGHARREAAGRVLSDIMSEMMFATTDRHRTVVDAVLDAARTHGADHPVVEDIKREAISYKQLLASAFVLGDLIAEETERGEYVGVLLPNTAGTVKLFLGLLATGRVPAMLNFSAGPQAVASAVTTAQIDTVYTSRLFVEAGKLEPLIERIGAHARVRYLEDLAPKVGLLRKLRGFLSATFPLTAYIKRCGRVSPEEPAVVLFTSGSEGTPKGVVLSHANLLANQAQMAARVDFSSRDVILNALPMFHSFGLTAGTLLPLFSGIKVFLYPSPLHFRIIPELAYDLNATILFGTDTFLSGYARFAHPYDFYSIRYVFAGAEKLREETRRIWSDRFGVRILEGYGATETSPVLANNTPMDNRAGTVGRLLPGIHHRLVPVPGLDEGGRLEVSGPNVMLGYLLAGRPGELVPPETEAGSGWYDTGDIVRIDDDGFVYILGRAKRFAKVAGEMVSLTAAEQLASRVWPGHAHAVVTVPDKAKGEKLILVTDCPEAKRDALLAHARSEGVGEIMVPRTVKVVDAVPVLGSGKTDYAGVAELVAEKGK